MPITALVVPQLEQQGAFDQEVWWVVGDRQPRLVEPDLVAELEAIGDGLRRVEDQYLYALSLSMGRTENVSNHIAGYVDM